MATPEQNVATVRRFFRDVFDGKDLEAAREMIADDFVEHQAMPGMSPDKDGAIKAMEMMFGGAPDMRTEVLDVVASGDRVASRAVSRGTDSGGIMPGTPATNKPFEMESIDIMRFDDDGKVVEHWGISDVMGAMGQLGLLPPPPS